MEWRRYLLMVLLGCGAGCTGLEKAAELLKADSKRAERATRSDDAFMTKSFRARTAESETAKETPAGGTDLAWARYYQGQAAQPGLDAARRADLHDKARSAFQEVLRHDSASLTALLGLGDVLAGQGEYERALAVYHRALKKYPKEPLVRVCIGGCLGKRGEWSDAVKSLETAVALAPKERQFQELLGRALVRAGRTEDGFQMLAKAIGSTEAHYRVAEVFREADQKDRCVHELYVTLAADPDYAPAQKLLDQVTAAQNAANADVATLEFRGDGFLPSSDVRKTVNYDIQRPDQDRIVFHNAVAQRIRSSWASGNGWCVVTGLQDVEALPGSGPCKHVKYRIAIAATFNGASNEPSVELYFGPESDWVVVHVNDNLTMPVNPGPASAVTDKARAAIHDLEALRFQTLAQITNSQTSAERRQEARTVFLPLLDRQIASMKGLLQQTR